MTNMPSSQKLLAIRKSMEEALAKVAEEHGIDSFKFGNIRYDESGFKVPLEAVFTGGETFDMKTLRQSAALLGFNPEIAGAKIKYANKEFTVVGVKRTNFSLQDAAGKVYSAKVEQVLHALTMQKSPLVRNVSTTDLPKALKF
jgi:hypothetical protein